MVGATNQDRISEKDYEFIRKFVYDQSRINLGPDKKELVSARLAKRLRAIGLNSYSEYCAFLQGPHGNDEVTNLVDVISTNHTYFFREIKHFEFLGDVIIPHWLQHGHKQGEKNFTLWSAASSSGEEPYSLAILMQEIFQHHGDATWSLDGTDISTRMLDLARRGVFEGDRLRDVKAEWLRRYFQKGVGQWEGYFRAKELLRSKLVFHHVNLLQPTYPFNKLFHVIFCRNVMIYFDRPTQEQLVNKLAEKLVPGGYLIVGHSESLMGITHSLATVRPSIYQKKA
jgi:chemotaxis protein methyltransferase CheR